MSWTEEVYGEGTKGFRPEEEPQEVALEAQSLSLDVGATPTSETRDTKKSKNNTTSDKKEEEEEGEGGREGGEELPQVSRLQVFLACLGTSALFVFLAGFLRSYASVWHHGGDSGGGGGGGGDDAAEAAAAAAAASLDTLLSGPQALDGRSYLAVVTALLLVTITRVGLLSVNEDFSTATQRSNSQVLEPLKTWDYLWLGFLPGISEEALFRGALLPATGFADWRGVIISAAVFGYFHRSGGRNTVFALWSTWVGVVYGAAFLTTQNLAVPMVAHSLSNIASAAIWKSKQKAD